MEVRLEGTGGPEGWPVPGCPCASCGRLVSGHRRPASILVDGRVRLTCRPGVAQECGPDFAQESGPDVAREGAEGVAREDARMRPAEAGTASDGAPGGPPATAGVLQRHLIRRTADGIEITGPGGGRLLYAVGPSAGAPGRDDGPPFDVVLMDLPDRPERLGDLRRRGRVTPATRIIAVDLDHRVATEGELTRRLGFWGVLAVPDGTVLTLAKTASPDTAGPDTAGTGTTGTGTTGTGTAGTGVAVEGAPDAGTASAGAHLGHATGTRNAGRTDAPLWIRPRRTLLLGGSRSGKSEEAELRLAAEPDVTYVATGPTGGDDPAWLARVRAHRDRRPAHWRTVETTDLAAVLAHDGGTFLVDGIGTWLAAVFDECGAWPDQPRTGDRHAAVDRVTERCDALVAAWRGTRARVVAVSDEVGLGVIPATAAGRLFRDALGRLNQALARESEDVALVVAGRVVPLPL